jgi:hypothetical protein
MNLKEIKLRKLNLLDIILVLVIVIFVGVFVITHFKSSEDGTVVTGNNSVNTTFTYTISVNGLSDTSREMIRSGDEVYDKVSNTYIGKIVEVNIKEAQGTLEKENGEIILASMPGKIDVDLTVETNGTVKNGDYLANGLIRIMVGNFKEIKTKYIMFSGTVSSITK